MIELGQVVMTMGVREEVDEFDIYDCLQRHQEGDFGEVSEDSVMLNNAAIKGGYDNILSVYTDRNGVKFWIITEADRSATTILLPEEY